MTKPELNRLYRVDVKGGYILFYHAVPRLDGLVFELMHHKDYVIIIDQRNLKRLQWVKVFVPRLRRNYFIHHLTFKQFLYDVEKSNESL